MFDEKINKFDTEKIPTCYDKSYVDTIREHLHAYTEKNYDPEIFSKAGMTIYDYEGHVFCIVPRHSNIYFFAVTHMDEKTNIVCTKNNRVVIKCQQIYKSKKDGNIVVEMKR